MNFDKILEHIRSIDLPTGTMSAVGIVLLFIAFKLGKFLFKAVVFLLAVALIAVAVWWHFHRP